MSNLDVAILAELVRIRQSINEQTEILQDMRKYLDSLDKKKKFDW